MTTSRKEDPVNRFVGNVVIGLLEFLNKISVLLLVFSAVAIFASVVSPEGFGGTGFQQFLGVVQGAAIDGAMVGTIVKAVEAFSDGKAGRGIVLSLVGIILSFGTGTAVALWVYCDMNHISTIQALSSFGIDSVSWAISRGSVFSVVGLVTAALLKQNEVELTEAEVAQLEKQRNLQARVANANAAAKAKKFIANLNAAKAAVDAARKGKSDTAIEADIKEEPLPVEEEEIPIVDKPKRKKKVSSSSEGEKSTGISTNSDDSPYPQDTSNPPPPPKKVGAQPVSIIPTSTSDKVVPFNTGHSSPISVEVFNNSRKTGGQPI